MSAHESDNVVRVVAERPRELSEHLAEDNRTLHRENARCAAECEKLRALDIELQNVGSATVFGDDVINCDDGTRYLFEA